MKTKVAGVSKLRKKPTVKTKVAISLNPDKWHPVIARALVEAIGGGMTFVQAAKIFNCSPKHIRAVFQKWKPIV